MTLKEITFSAVSYLHELRHTKIGYIGEQNNEICYTAFKDDLEEMGKMIAKRDTCGKAPKKRK